MSEDVREQVACQRVLLLEPFYGGSHRQLIDLINKSIPECTLITLPASKWHWRARTSALYFSFQIPSHHSFSVLFASSVLNLAELVALRPDLSGIRKVLYFHENQLVYPVQKHQDRDFQYGYNQILSCLVADAIVFNSRYNQESFLTGIESFLKLMPNRPRGLAEKIRPKCRVLYFPIDFPSSVNNAKPECTEAGRTSPATPSSEMSPSDGTHHKHNADHNPGESAEMPEGTLAGCRPLSSQHDNSNPSNMLTCCKDGLVQPGPRTASIKDSGLEEIKELEKIFDKSLMDNHKGSSISSSQSTDAESEGGLHNSRESESVDKVSTIKAKDVVQCTKEKDHNLHMKPDTSPLPCSVVEQHHLTVQDVSISVENPTDGSTYCHDNSDCRRSDEFGMEDGRFQRCRMRGPLHILWPHRWEHDKNPDEFFSILFQLSDEGCNFHLSVLGENYLQTPPIFHEAEVKLKDHIVDWGFLPSKEDYYQVLSMADVVVSTANHEFFGVAMLESTYFRCYPLCPQRLVYPEIFPAEHLYRTSTQLLKKLRRFCRNPELPRSHKFKGDLSKYSWQTLQPDYLKVLI